MLAIHEVRQKAALGRRLQRAAVDPRRRGLALAAGKLAQQNARVLDQPLEAFPTLAIQPSWIGSAANVSTYLGANS